MRTTFLRSAVRCTVLLAGAAVLSPLQAGAANAARDPQAIDKRAPHCFRYGREYHSAGDLLLARQWYRQAASLGLPEAMFQLAMMYESGEAGVQDYTEALKLHRQAAERGHRGADRRAAAIAAALDPPPGMRAVFPAPHPAAAEAAARAAAAQKPAEAPAAVDDTPDPEAADADS